MGEDGEQLEPTCIVDQIVKWLLGCTPQACKPCTCPASRSEKELGVGGDKHHRFNPGIPNLFDNRNRFCGIFFHGLRGGGIFWDDPSAWYLICTLFLLFIVIISAPLQIIKHSNLEFGDPWFNDRWSYLHSWSKVLEQHLLVCDCWAERGGTSRSRGRGGHCLWRHQRQEAHWLPGKLAKGHAPYSSYEWLTGGDVLI